MGASLASPPNLHPSTGSVHGEHPFDAYYGHIARGFDLPDDAEFWLRSRGFELDPTGLDPRAVAKNWAEVGMSHDMIVRLLDLDLDDIPYTSPEAPTVLELHARGYTPHAISLKIENSRAWVYVILKRHGLEPHRRRNKELTARQVDMILESFDKGVPMTQIAKLHKVGYDQVRAAVEKALR